MTETMNIPDLMADIGARAKAAARILAIATPQVTATLFKLVKVVGLY
jgi:hypothetical protein